MERDVSTYPGKRHLDWELSFGGPLGGWVGAADAVRGGSRSARPEATLGASAAATVASSRTSSPVRPATLKQSVSTPNNTTGDVIQQFFTDSKRQLWTVATIG